MAGKIKCNCIACQKRRLRNSNLWRKNHSYSTFPPLKLPRMEYKSCNCSYCIWKRNYYRVKTTPPNIVGPRVKYDWDRTTELDYGMEAEI